jgi:hypothetical protein
MANSPLHVQLGIQGISADIYTTILTEYTSYTARSHVLVTSYCTQRKLHL